MLDKIKEATCTALVRLQDAPPVDGEIILATFSPCGHEATSSKLPSDIQRILTALLDDNARILLAHSYLADPQTTSPTTLRAVGRFPSYGEIFEMDGVKMKTLAEQIEEMRTRMNDWAKSEVGLVNTLGHSLTEADNKLLDDVRHLASEHEARRAEISKELQALASRLGVLPTAREATASIKNDVPLITPPFTKPGQSEQARDHGERRVAASASMADELSKHLVAARAIGR